MSNTDKTAKVKRQKPHGKRVCPLLTGPLFGYQLDLSLARRVVTFAICLLAFAFTSACRQDMHDQPKYKPLEPIENIGSITDGRASRPLVEGTVARGSLADDPYLLAGRPAGAAQAITSQNVAAAAPLVAEQTPSSQVSANVGGQAMTTAAQPAQGQPPQNQTGEGQTSQGFSNTFPLPVTMEVIDRGEERYNSSAPSATTGPAADWVWWCGAGIADPLRCTKTDCARPRPAIYST
jgi:hypothetical protein